MPRGIIAAVEGIGYHAHPFAPERVEADESAQAKWLLRCLAVAGFAAMNVMLLSVSIWAGNVSDMTPETRDLFHWLSALIALPAAAYAGQPFFQSALKALRARQLNMDVPISLGVILALGLSVFETATHAAHAYFDSAIMLLFFLLGRPLSRSGDAAQDAAVRRQSRRAESGDRAPARSPTANSCACPPPRCIPATSCWCGRASASPADGTVIDGRRRSTRAWSPARRCRARVRAGMTLYAGSINISGALTMRVTAAGAGTLLEEVERLLDQRDAGAVAVRAARRPRRAPLCAGRACHRGADR